MEEDIAEDFRSLGLELHASPQQVEDAYARKVSLYAEHSLATYALFDEDGRQAQLRRLEGACNRIRAVRVVEISELPPVADPGGGKKDEAVEVPDPVTSPGRFLQAHRIQNELTLREIAARTKISSKYLSHIEEEHFDLLPAPVYLRGFVIAFARILELSDPESISRFFLARCEEQAGSSEP